LIGVFVFGNALVGLEEKIIHFLLGNSVNYEAFEFVVYCSGIVSVSAYLGVIAGFLAIKQRVDCKMVWAGVILLFLINILRIMLVMLSEKVGWHHTTHVMSWFLMVLVILWQIKKSLK
jgi:exosortase/archaeosortase family protein